MCCGLSELEQIYRGHQSPFLDTLTGFEYTSFFLSSQLIHSEQDTTDGTSCHLENPVLALSIRTVSMIMELGIANLYLNCESKLLTNQGNLIF